MLFLFICCIRRTDQRGSHESPHTAPTATISTSATTTEEEEAAKLNKTKLCHFDENLTKKKRSWICPDDDIHAYRVSPRRRREEANKVPNSLVTRSPATIRNRIEKEYGSVQ